MRETPQPWAPERLLAVGSMAGAILASSCCVLPLALVTLGIGGAWMSNLTALAPYKAHVLAGTLVALGAGFWHVYRRPANACEPGTSCAVPASRRFTKTVLWLAAGLVALAASVDVWAPWFW